MESGAVSGSREPGLASRPGPSGFDPGDEPQLIKRHCGGWLARANKKESLRIAVTANTEEAARTLFFERLAAWRETLEVNGFATRGRKAVAADFGLRGPWA